MIKFMNSKLQVLKALSHEKPDRVPFNFWMDRRLMDRYEKQFGHRHWRVTRYNADVIETFASLDFPHGRRIEHEGSPWMTEPYPMSWDHIEKIPLPNPQHDNVYSNLQRDIQEFPNHAIFLDLITTFGVIAGMRGYENIYLDMLDHPDEFKALSRRIGNVLNVAVERACKMGITALYLMEDLATARGLSMSPDMMKEFCLDFAIEQVHIAKKYGIPVLFHSCGKIMDLLKPLIDMGICCINPLQPHLNDFQEFESLYGKDLAVYGGLDNSFIIPYGTPDEVRKHVLEVFEILGSNDGSLILSTHDIPFDTPAENIETMIKTIVEQCHYN